VTGHGEARTGADTPRVSGGDRSWRLRQQFAHRVRPLLGDLLDDARRLEPGLRSAGQEVLPASVLVRTNGLDIAVTVTAKTTVEAVRRGRALIEHVAQRAGVQDLGIPLRATVRPIGGPAE